jgi:hypothetical protein
MMKLKSFYLRGMLCLFSASLPSIVTAQTEPAPTAQTASVRLPYGDIIRLREGDVRVASGIVARDQPLVSIPYAYRRTAVLTADVADGGFWGGGNRIYLKAGAKGYWAGSFSSGSFLLSSASRNLWCFFGVNQRDVATQACFLSDFNGKFIMVAGGHLVTSFVLPQSVVGTLDLNFEEKVVEILADARLEYRFREWDDKDADVHLFVGNSFINNSAIGRQADGSALLFTQAGQVRLRQSGTDRRSATASLEAAPPVVQQTAPAVQNAAAVQTLADAYAGMRLFMMAVGGAQFTTIYNKTAGLVPDATQRPVRAGQEIARESFVPARVGRLDVSPLGRANRFGAIGDLVFEVKPDKDRSLMCWRHYLAGGGINPTGARLLGMCLEDKDKDGKYETLWKDVTFQNDMHYQLNGLNTQTTLEDRNPPVTITPADSNLMAPETLRLIYQGSGSERRNANGALEPATAKLEWASTLLPATPREIFSQTIILNNAGQGQTTASDTIPVIELSNVAIAGTASVRVLSGFASRDSDFGTGELLRKGQALFERMSGSQKVESPQAAPTLTPAVPEPKT